MERKARRGFVPSDEKDFGEEALPVLRKASEELRFLWDRGYPVTSTVRFIGDRYQFSERQRLALARVVSPTESIASRKSREVGEISGRTLFIDGFNVIIGLETAFSQSMLFCCPDGSVRDLAGLRGSYRPIPETVTALKALLKALGELGVSRAVIYLDRPVSNSGRLKELIDRLAEGTGFETETVLEDRVDTVLKGKPLVASGDAVILDACGEWFALARYVIDTQIGNYPYTDITG
ncbi:MAG: DUF434 domain-containing protein [Ruminococcus sp.]|nr:DUF434 domain-containing protein [Ruminococcus sp.]